MKPALLPDLATFVTIVEHGNFSTAARITGATPSAISRCVSRLEQEMGSKLLHRTTRKLALTETGKSVYEHALDMLEAAQQAMDSGSSVQTVAQGKLTVSVPKAVGRFVIHPLIPEFLERYPQIDVCLRLEDRYMDLIDDGVDLALRITSTPSPGLYGKPLMPVTHVICATPEYLRRAGTPQHPHDLRAHSCISLGETPADSRWKFTLQGKTEIVQTHGRYAANHTGVRLDAVLQNIGIGSLPYFTARQALEQGEVVQVLPAWNFIASYHGGVWLLHTPTRYLPPKLRVFIDFLVERLAQEPTLGPKKDPRG